MMMQKIILDCYFSPKSSNKGNNLFPILSYKPFPDAKMTHNTLPISHLVTAA